MRDPVGAAVVVTGKPRRVVVDPVVEMPLSRLRPWDKNLASDRPSWLRDLMASDASRAADARGDRGVLALPDGTVFAGMQRLAAAPGIGVETLPVIVVHGLTPAQVKTWALLANGSFGMA